LKILILQQELALILLILLVLMVLLFFNPIPDIDQSHLLLEGKKRSYGQHFREPVRNHIFGFGIYHVDTTSIDFLSQPMVMYIDVPKFRLQSRDFFGDETNGLDVVTLNFDTLPVTAQEARLRWSML